MGVSTGASPREKNTAKEKVQLQYFESGVRSQLAELSSTGARPWYDATSSSCRATRTPGVARFRPRLLSLYSKPFFRFFFFIFVRFRNREGGCFPSSFFSFVSRDVSSFLVLIGGPSRSFFFFCFRWNVFLCCFLLGVPRFVLFDCGRRKPLHVTVTGDMRVRWRESWAPRQPADTRAQEGRDG